MICACFSIMHKSEYTRQLLKWALLCAATKQCINPDGSKLGCPQASSTPSCHRFDQSVFALLTINNEYQRHVLDNDKNFLPHFHSNHPRTKIRYQLQRGTSLDKNLDFKKGVKCCQKPFD
uniref:Uncharacterized protein n=2 Tax=Meloidogyne incognita TaxID=6306 RepID=A0A914MRJ3_MELIC